MRGGNQPPLIIPFMPLGVRLMSNTAIMPLAARMAMTFRDWLIDNNKRVYCQVAVSEVNVEEIGAYGQRLPDGSLAICVLDVSPRALGKFDYDGEFMQIQAMFGGKPTTVWVPWHDLIYVYDPDANPGEIQAIGAAEIPNPTMMVVNDHQSVMAARTARKANVVSIPSAPKRPTLSVVRNEDE